MVTSDKILYADQIDYLCAFETEEKKEKKEMVLGHARDYIMQELALCFRVN